MNTIAKILTVCLLSVVTGCQYVDTGCVGVKVNYYGSGKGVSDTPIAQGNTLYNPFTQAIYEFPVYEQNHVWTGVDAIEFNDKTGTRVSVDMAIQYSFTPALVPKLFTQLRRDAEYIGHNYLKIQVRDKINREAKKLSVTDIFGSEGSEMLDRSKAAVNQEFEDVGIVIHMLSFNSDMRVDERIRESINRVITATQDAIAAENKVKQIKAESDQAIERSRGESESVLVRAKKQAEANIELSKSLTPELMKYRALEKWDGVLPRVTSDSSSMSLFIDPSK